MADNRQRVYEFIDALTAAATRVPQDYFRLQTTFDEEGVYGERLYCYELYHQARLICGDRGLNGYQLCGEVSKRAHPLFLNARPENRPGMIPDFIFHQPGTMDGNLVAVEVKPLHFLNRGGLEKDVLTLSDLVQYCQYQTGVLLLFGGTPHQIEYAETNLRDLIQEKHIPINDDNFKLIWHADTRGNVQVRPAANYQP